MPAAPAFNTDQMRLIALIDERRSFSRAAQSMGISQSAVSQQVRAIEQALGRRLFDRGPSGPRTTQDGEAYLVYARAMLAIGEDAQRHFAGPALDGEIRLGLTEDFARTALPGVLALFSRDHPRFAFTVDCGFSTELFSGIAEQRYDIVVAKRSEPTREEDRLWSEPLSWFGRDEAVGAAGDVLPLALMPAPSVTREAVLQALRRAGRPWRVAFQSLSLSALEAVVRAGIGYAAFGQHFGPPDLTELHEGLPPLGSVAMCLETSERRRSDAVDAFCALIRQAALHTVGAQPAATDS